MQFRAQIAIISKSKKHQKENIKSKREQNNFGGEERKKEKYTLHAHSHTLYTQTHTDSDFESNSSGKNSYVLVVGCSQKTHIHTRILASATSSPAILAGSKNNEIEIEIARDGQQRSRRSSS